MSDIEIPISAPGAEKAAKDIDRTRLAVEELAKAEKRKAEYDKVVAQYARERAEYEARFTAAIERRAKRWGDEAAAMRPVTRELITARNEMKRFNEQGQFSLSNRAQRKLLNLIPGGRVIDDIGDVMEGARGSGAARMAAGLGVLTASLLVAKTVFDLNSERIAENNKQLQDRIRVDQKLLDQERKLADERDSTAAKSFGNIRGAARFILGTQGAQGESDVRRAMNFGGEEAVKALADLLKTRSKDIKRSGYTAGGILTEAMSISDTTGADAAEVLKALASQKGKLNFEKVLKDLMGGMSLEMWNLQSEKGLGTGLGGLIEQVGDVDRAKRRVQAQRTLDPTMVLRGAVADLENLVDPMKKVIAEHNAGIQKEIEVREQLLVAERSFADWWLEFAAKNIPGASGLGNRSTAGKAGVEIKNLLGQQR